VHAAEEKGDEGDEALRRHTLARRGILAGALLAGGILLLARRSPPRGPIPARGGRSMDVRVAGADPLYLQRDRRWAEERIGETGQTLSAVGCLICSLAMGSEALGVAIDPAELNRRLSAAHGYTKDAWVIWGAVPGATDGAVEVAVHDRPEHAILDDALARGELPVVKFVLPSGAPHWVLVVGKAGDEYLIKDPLVPKPAIVRLGDRAASIHAVRVLRRAVAIRTGVLVTGARCPARIRAIRCA
jgi:hypothetical protein